MQSQAVLSTFWNIFTMNFYIFGCLKILQTQNMLQIVSNGFKILRFRKIMKNTSNIFDILDKFEWKWLQKFGNKCH